MISAPVSFFFNSVWVVLAGLSCRDCLVARQTISQPRISLGSQNFQPKHGGAEKYQHRMFPCLTVSLFACCLLCLMFIGAAKSRLSQMLMEAGLRFEH